jgi:transcriptional regulator with XRE-family HTH domain
MTKAPVSFPAALAAALKAAKMSQSDLARAVGCSRARISEYVAGSKLPRRVMLERINEALGGTNLSPTRPISVEEVARDLKAEPETVRRGLRGGQLSMLGVAIPSPNGKRHKYIIFPEKYKELVSAGS